MMSVSEMVVLALVVLLICAASVSAAGKTTSITVHPTDEKQVMHSFGASDCWTCQFVGNWPDAKRNQMADLLFSMDTDAKGNPKGIGLSMWRFNVGAGSAEEGDASGIRSSWQRAECFQKPDGSYDWSKQKGQQWFLQAAKSRGVPYLLAFTNSPPVQFTRSGMARSDGHDRMLNIRKDAMPKFADFLVEVAEHFRKQGLPFDYLSPINEPQHPWETEKQEGSPATNDDIAEIARLLGQRLHDRGLTTKVAVAEAGALYYVSGPRGDNKAADQAKAFFAPASQDYIGDVPNLAHMISGHSYFTTWPISTQLSTREALAKRLAEIDPKLAFWQTEFCILEKNDEIGQGGGRDLGMDTALYVARVIHSDLTIANASHWSWWLGVSAGDFKDGLVYIEPENGGGRESLEHDGKVLPSKLLWAMGNYSRFIRPGMVRVDVAYDDNRSALDAATGVMASAYVDKKAKRLVVVLINCSKESQTIKVNGGPWVTYTTSESSDLARGSAPAGEIEMPARSVVTAIADFRFSIAD